VLLDNEPLEDNAPGGVAIELPDGFDEPTSRAGASEGGSRFQSLAGVLAAALDPCDGTDGDGTDGDGAVGTGNDGGAAKLDVPLGSPCGNSSRGRMGKLATEDVSFVRLVNGNGAPILATGRWVPLERSSLTGCKFGCVEDLNSAESTGAFPSLGSTCAIEEGGRSFERTSVEAS